MQLTQNGNRPLAQVTPSCPDCTRDQQHKAAPQFQKATLMKHFFQLFNQTMAAK